MLRGKGILGRSILPWSVRVARPVQLKALTLSLNALVENAAAGTPIGAVLGTSFGSTLALLDDGGGRVAISGATLVAGLVPATGADFDIVLREALEAATNSPRDTVLTINVTPVPRVVTILGTPPPLVVGEPYSWTYLASANDGSPVEVVVLNADDVTWLAARGVTHDGVAHTFSSASVLP